MIFTCLRPNRTADHRFETIDGLSYAVGDPSGLRFATGSIVTIYSWGAVPFSSMEYMFGGCHVEILCDESPVFAPGCSLKGMFRWCANFNHDISHWDVSNVADMSSMFSGCRAFNRDLRWDVSNVANMSGMFRGCRSLNRKIRWDVSNVTDMSGMFYGCVSFNQNLRWDTSKVTNMDLMFVNCESLRQRLRWNTSNVTHMNRMFMGCTNFDRRVWRRLELISLGERVE